MGSGAHVDAEVQEVLAHAEQPLPSLTPHRKPASRSPMLRNSWSHQQSVCLNPSQYLGELGTQSVTTSVTFEGALLQTVQQIVNHF